MLRRDFIKAMSASVALATVAQPELVFASSNSLANHVGNAEQLYQYMANSPYLLDIQRAGERYQVDLRYPNGVAIAAYMLRDIRANRQGYPNLDLLKLAAWSQAWLASQRSHTLLHINSGLRTQKTNSAIEGAARNSRHLPDSRGIFYAMDVRPEGVDRSYFGELISKPKFGGVGWYSTHVHFDIRDKVAYWGKR